LARMSGEIVIRRPVDEVFDFVADERNRYDPAIIDAEKVTEGPIGEGTRFRTLTRGRRPEHPVEMTVEITRHERPGLLATTTRLPSMRVDTTMAFDEAEGGTLLRWSSSLRPHGAFRLMGPLLSIVGRRQEQRIWQGLKEVMERRGG
jgi:hypothetical protein